MSSSPATRAAARDYWNSPRAVRVARALDYTAAALFATALLIAGSLNL
jgi:hypothetical protein